MEKATTIRDPSFRLRRVEGRHNPLVKELRSAFSHGELTKHGYCAIEGLRILEEAIRSSLRFRAVFFSESAAARAQRLLSQIGAHVETLLLPDKLFSTVVPSETPQGVAALARWKEFSLEEVLARSQGGSLLAVSGVQDPGNLGTILRSAEAFGAGGIVLGEGTVSVFNPKVVRASAGSVFRIPVVRTKLADAAIETRPAIDCDLITQRRRAGSGEPFGTTSYFYWQRGSRIVSRSHQSNGRSGVYSTLAKGRIAERRCCGEHCIVRNRKTKKMRPITERSGEVIDRQEVARLIKLTPALPTGGYSIVP